MKKDFYAVYCIKLDQKEIDQAVELDIIDDNDRFEAFCLKSKNRELVGIFKSNSEADDYVYMMNNEGFGKLSEPFHIIKQIEIEINENIL